MGKSKQVIPDRRSLSNMIAERDKLIAELRARVIIRSPEQKLIQRAGRERVKLLLGGRDSAIYRRFSRKYFSSMWNGYRDKFNVRSFRDTRESDFDNAVLWIGTWQARGPLRISAEQIELELKEHEE